MLIYDEINKLDDNENKGLVIAPLAYVILDCAR